MLILMAGLPGTGKTHVAEKLAESLDAVILSKDTVRHALFPPELIEYSTGQDDFVIDVLLETAAYIWNKHPTKTVILDGRTFAQATQRQHAVEFADRAGQKWRIVECFCAPGIAKQRLAKPDPIHPAGNRTSQLYDEVKARWEPIAHDHVAVRTDTPVNLADLVRKLTA